MENVLFIFAELPVYSYGFMIGLGFLFGSLLAQREAKRRGFGMAVMFDFIVKTTLVFLAFGRAAFVMAIHGWRMLTYPWVLFTGAQVDEVAGLWAAGFYAVYYIVRHSTNPFGFVDSITPSMALIQSMANLGSNVFGTQTSVPWAFSFGQFALHPVQLYAAILYYFVFSILWRCRRNTRFDGQIFLGYLALSSGVQWFLLRFREVSESSTNPWLYILSTLALSGFWIYLYINSPLTAPRKRQFIGSHLIWLLSMAGVALTMTFFFFWRYS